MDTTVLKRVHARLATKICAGSILVSVRGGDPDVRGCSGLFFATEAQVKPTSSKDEQGTRNEARHKSIRCTAQTSD